LFRDVRAEVRDRLAACATTKNVQRGKIIFSKGDPGLCLFAVFSGIVQIITPSAEGKNAVFNLVREGEVFGEIALLDGGPRTADALAFTDCKLVLIERGQFISVLHTYPEFAIKLLEVVCSRLRRTTEQVEDLMFLDLRSRLGKTLLRLSRLGGQREIVISQEQLSEIVGMSREMINKQLQVWAKERWIKLARKQITVLDHDALARMIADE
jgi:CRP-like cAMP-binding protein